MSDTIQTRPTIDGNGVMLTGFTEHRTGGFQGPGKVGAITIDEAMTLLDWLPQESTSVSATFLTTDGFTTVQDPDSKFLRHPETGLILGRHLQGYAVHGYADTLLRDASAITDGELGIARVTVLGGGKRAAVQYEFNDDVTTTKGVQFRPFLSAATSLDGSIATSFFTGATAIICDNTLNLAINRAKRAGEIYRVKHTRNSQVNVAVARTVLGIISQVADEFTEEIERLTNEYVSDQKWKDFLDAIAPEAKPGASVRTTNNAERKRAELNRLWNFDERVAPWKNSAYGAVAAVNTWTNHVQNVKGDRGERNVARMIDGTFAKADTLALRTLARI